MSHDYLADLNKQQRQAVKYGSVEEAENSAAGPFSLLRGPGPAKQKPLPIGSPI